MPYQPYQSTWNNPYLPQVQQPQYSPVVPSITNAYTQPVNGVVKVNGRDSAMQYQLPPNSMSPALFDNSGKVFYIVSTDGTGTKSIETFDFSPHDDEPPIEVDGAEFVSRKEFDEFTAKVNAALGAINGLHATVQPAPADVSGAGDAGGAVAREASSGRHAGRARQGDAV